MPQAARNLWPCVTISPVLASLLTRLLGSSGLCSLVRGLQSDRQHLATAGHDATAQVYALDLRELLDLAHRRVSRNLTPDECTRFFQTEKCPALQ